MQRDNFWLNQRLQEIWQKYFSDLKQSNPIFIGFGKKAKNRLGSIKFLKESQSSVIILSGYLRNPEIPKFVLDAILAHEVVHYLHGFASPERKMWRYPHQGGIVNQELKKRGLSEILALEKKWLKKYHGEFFSKKT